jgi:tetratricopeptide (TPR) repeat protein
VVTTEAAPYDYSQPVVLNNYVSSDADAAGGAAQPVQVQETPEQQQSLGTFDAGLDQFKAGNYGQALDSFNAALRQLPGDPVVHEVRALTLFALGDYRNAAVALDSLLSSAPGMDWTTMSSLYGNDDDYTAQLRKLEAYCKANPKDAAAAFVLAYHYLTLGEKDAAVDMLQVVVANQPKDYTAKRMLDALAPSQMAATPAPATPSPGSAGAYTDLVGKWQAKTGNTTVELTIGDDSQFTWKAIQPGKPAVELKGQVTTNGDSLMLENAKQGSISGAVKSGGPDQWQFNLTGAPSDDPGLAFVRKKA